MLGQHDARREPVCAHSVIIDFMSATSICGIFGKPSCPYRMHAGAQVLVRFSSARAKDGDEDAFRHKRFPDAICVGCEPSKFECESPSQRVQLLCEVAYAVIASPTPSRVR